LPLRLLVRRPHERSRRENASRRTESGKTTKPNALPKKADRPWHRVITKNQFTPLETMDEVIKSLIGDLPVRPSLGLELGAKSPISP
jgi:hypothetical protein